MEIVHVARLEAAAAQSHNESYVGLVDC
jgi:hypothetical protein